MPTTLTVATVNILFDTDDWHERGPMLVASLLQANPDLLALQEVGAEPNRAKWLAEQLGYPHVFFVPTKTEVNTVKFPPHGNAILSRYPFQAQETLALTSQNRVAQRVVVETPIGLLGLVNSHYYWHPGHHPERTKQVQQVHNWLADLPPDLPRIVAGDFNGTPDTEAMQWMRAHYSNAYVQVHGQNPAYTAPTPLGGRQFMKRVRQFLINLYANRTLKPWRGTLDYIFYNGGLQAVAAETFLNTPAPHDARLYPTDHLGLLARFEKA